MSVDSSLDGASPWRIAVLTVRFLLELALLTGAAVAAWNLAPGGWRWPAVFLAPVVIGIAWALFLSPKAKVPLPGLGAFLLEALLFLGVGIALFFAGHGLPALIGIVLWAAHRIALGFSDN